MASNMEYAITTIAETRWCELSRSKKDEHRTEKWLLIGLTGAGIAALILWVRVVLEMITDISLAGAAYFGA